MSFLLLETGDKLLQENGFGILLDVILVDFADVSQINLGSMVCLKSIDLGELICTKSINMDNMVAVSSINLGDFTVRSDA